MMLNSWESVVGMPIVRKVNGHWNNPDVLEKILRVWINYCASDSVRTNGDRTILITLSGGIDSSLCLALIKKEEEMYSEIIKSRIHTFTIGESINHPDVVHARLVAKLFKTIHHEFIPTPLEIRTAIEEKRRNPDLFIGDGSLEFGGIGVYLLYKYIAKFKTPAAVICHDGIDELLGGYWPHRQDQSQTEQAMAFEKFWRELTDKHLVPLTRKSGHFNLCPIFPYLQKRVVSYITAIPLEERTSKAESKMPLRRIAEKYLPREIIERKKIGFCDAMKEF